MSLIQRARRLRENPKLRKLVSEHSILLKDLVQPLFIKEGISHPQEISSMPGQFQHAPASLIEEAGHLEQLGVPAVILFGIPARKDLKASQAFASSGVVQKAIGRIKKKCQGLLVITDVCLCEYMSHGHCGVTKTKGTGKRKEVRVENDATLELLAKAALSHARAGADVVAPSDMMDGRVAAIRRTLDAGGFKNLPIISYAVKYGSAFYGPFREAAESAPRFGDRKSYQMDTANAREALKEARTDLEEGADAILVKPALAYLDIVRGIKDRFDCALGAYSVSGEYAMIKAAAAKGWVDEKAIVTETHLAMKRAGAGFIFTYWAKDLARWKAALK